MLEGLDHIGAGHERGDGRQLVEHVEAEALQEQRGGAVEHGLARALVAGHLVDQAPVHQGADHAVDVDAADRRDLGPGEGLLVGHDGQGLQRRARQPGRLALQHVALHVGGGVGVALEPVPARHPGQDEAPALGLVGRGQGGAGALHRIEGHLQQLGQHLGRDRVGGHHHDGLQGLADVGRQAGDRIGGGAGRGVLGLHQPS